MSITLDICDLCIKEDFGYCANRNSPKPTEYEYNKNDEVIKCSEFIADISAINKKYRLEIK